MRRLMYVSIMLMLSVACAQDKKLPVLSTEDQLEARQLEIDSIQDNNAYQIAQKNLQADINKQQEFWKRMYLKYKLDENKYIVCDGQSSVGCEGVARGELVFRPKPEEKKAEEKKTETKK